MILDIYFPCTMMRARVRSILETVLLSKIKGQQKECCGLTCILSGDPVEVGPSHSWGLVERTRPLE